MSGLDQILSGTPTEETPPPAPPAPEPDHVPEREPPPAREPEPGENQPSAPPAEEREEARVPISAVQDERRKRQEQERIAQEYAQKLAQYEAQFRQYQQPPEPERPDLFADPDGALNYMEQRFRQDMDRKILNMSVAAAKRAYPDYAEAEAAFIQAVQANPTLYDAMMNDPDPAGYAYRIGQQVQVLREVGADPVAYREKVRQEEREAARREWEAQQASQPTPPPRPNIPPSLAASRNSQGRFQPAWGGPPSLKDILSPRR